MDPLKQSTNQIPSVQTPNSIPVPNPVPVIPPIQKPLTPPVSATAPAPIHNIPPAATVMGSSIPRMAPVNTNIARPTIPTVPTIPPTPVTVPSRTSVPRFIPTPPASIPSQTQVPNQSFQRPSSFPNYGGRFDMPAAPPSIPAFAPKMPHRSSRSKWLIGLGILIPFLLIGLVYFAYSTITPARAIPAAFSDADSMSKKHVGFLVTLDSDDPQMSSLSFSVASDIDKESSGPSGTQSRVYLESKGISVAGDFLIVNGIIYGQLTNLPDMLAKQLSKYMNHWYSLSINALKSTAKIDDASLSAVSQQKLNSVSGIYEKLYMGGVLKNASFAGFTSYNGKLVRRYSIDIDKAALSALLDAFMSDKNASKSDIVSGGVSTVDDNLSSMEFYPIIMTVDLFSGSLEEIKLETRMSIPATRFTPATEGVVRFILTYGPVEEGKVISAPKNAESLDSLLLGLFAKPATSTPPVQTTKPKSPTR